ncbi:aconitase X swivel domain-containing protein [Microbacterium sp. A93]|uniref:aconitase X swivel domain-containing protein n=1 Tax=Microbacterium sp. A93 TaxID=3450716 RepID=UPI003F4250CE
MSIQIRGRGIVPGITEGEALVSQETISGWGGIDPAQGVIIESRHELFNVCFTDKVLIFPGAKGSSGWSGFFQSTRLMGTAPRAMVFSAMTTKAVLGAVVTRVPTISELDQDPLQVITTGDWVVVDADRGIITVTPQADRLQTKRPDRAAVPAATEGISQGA